MAHSSVSMKMSKVQISPTLTINYNKTKKAEEGQ